jgi:hypothetical protein
MTEQPRKDGTVRIGLSGIFVDEQDHAERFYTAASADAERLRARGGVRRGFRLWLELLSDLARRLDGSTSGGESPAVGGNDGR